MALFLKLRKKLGVKPPHVRERRLLDDAIRSGRLALHSGLDRYFSEVQKILGWDDSLDVCELEMCIEEYGKPVRTVGDLVQMFEAFDSEYEVADR